MARNNPFGHKDECQCQRCVEWEEDQADMALAGQGLALLRKMKENKESVPCTSCGTSIPTGSKFCPQCGSKQAAKKAVVKITTRPINKDLQSAIVVTNNAYNHTVLLDQNDQGELVLVIDGEPTTFPAEKYGKDKITEVEVSD